MNYSLPFEKENRKIISRYESKTSPDFGKNPKERTIKELLNLGFVNLDKYSGPTSHEVADIVKKVLKVKTCGHGGTLDPRVTGVLPIGLNKATKILQVFLHGGKEYVCEMKIHQKVTKKELMEAFKKFTGKIDQLPPIKSSVKREWREREIYYINLLEFEDKTALFRVGCEAGTYIRKLCTDIGDYLKVKAHMQDLRRTQASCFKEEDSVTIFDLQDAMTLFEEKKDESLLRKCIIPMEDAVSHLKKIYASDGAISAITNGAPLMLPGVVKMTDNIAKGNFVAIMSLKDELVALGEALMSSKEMVKNSKGIAVSLKRVMMSPEVYKREPKK